MSKRFLAGIFTALSLLISTGADAIQQANVPPKFAIPWGNSAPTPYIRSIPQPSQIGIVNCAASLTDGFPPLSFVPASAGGCAPFGQDFNGILKQITQWSQWYSAGGPIYYDAAFATGSANGYPNGAVVQSSVVPGDFWLNTADNNTSNPDTGGANWVPLPGMAQTGQVQWWFGPTIPFGWVAASPQTIGNASSGANVANSTTQLLYAFLWNNFSNSQCPVSGGRGANAAADFAANKAIQVVNMAGDIQVGNDLGQGVLTGVPIIFGAGITSNGSVIGEVFHTLTVAQIPSHTHNGSGTTSNENADHTHVVSGTTGAENQSHTHVISPGGTMLTGTAATGFNTSGSTPGIVNLETLGPSTGTESAQHNHNLTITSSGISNNHQHTYSFTTDGGTGGGGAHNNTPRSMVGYWIIKL